MKSNAVKSQNSKAGGVAITLLVISFSLAVAVTSYLHFSLNNARLSYRAREFQRARLLAASALDSAKNQLSIALINADIGLTTGNLQTQLNDPEIIVPPTFEQHDASFGLAVFAMDLKQEGGFAVTNSGNKEIAFQDVQITVGVTNELGVAAACTERIKIIREPYLRYILFFNELLELHPGPNMFVDGDIRSNADIELWANHQLYFDGSIHCPGNIHLFKSDKEDSYSTESRKKSVAQRMFVMVGDDYESFYQNNSYLDSTQPTWNQDSLNAWRGLVLASDSVKQLNPPLGSSINNHVLIEPPDNENDSPRVRNEKMANKADLYIKVDEDGDVMVTAGGRTTRYNSADYALLTGEKNEDHGVYEIENNGWLNIHTDYSDPRESDLALSSGPKFGSQAQDMRMVDIYMDQLLDQHPDANVVYVEVEDPSSSSLKPAVRLRNGTDLGAAGSDGISISTHRTMFIEGDFNCTRPSYTYTGDGTEKNNNGHGNNEDGVDSSSPGKSKSGQDSNPNVDDEKKNKNNGNGNGSDTTIIVPEEGIKVPVLIAADNLTLLSNKWNDKNSTQRRPRPAVETTLNAAVMIGYNDPENLAGNSGTTYTGGAHNLVRFRENWKGIDYNFTGSYMSLWHAQDSHCLIHGRTYSPPDRHINYDLDFLTTEPPGMPMGYTEPITLYWKEISIQDALDIDHALKN